MPRSPSLVTPALIVGCLFLLISSAVRGSYGVFQIPIGEAMGWARAEFSLAMAIQNLAWGISQPIVGALAEKIGDRKALALGILAYAGGLVLTGSADSPYAMQVSEAIVGFGIAGIGFGVILAMIGRAASDERRSMSLAIATAAGSAGQVIGAPVAEALLSVLSWSAVFFVFSGVIFALLFALPFMRVPPQPRAVQSEAMSDIVGRALRDPSFILIFIGFFSCGYQLAFVTSHFPAFVTELCGPIAPGSVLHGLGITTTSALGAVAISLIGLFNVIGTLAAGWLGARFPKQYLLAAIYTGRTLICAVFILMPITPGSVLVFSAVMGALWLATVPLTSGLVAQLFGLRYMGTLFGIVFFSHQLGGFMGVWLGGRMYDAYGDYTLVWWIGVGVGALSALVHLPVRDKPVVAAAA